MKCQCEQGESGSVLSMCGAHAEVLRFHLREQKEKMDMAHAEERGRLVGLIKDRDRLIVEMLIEQRRSVKGEAK